MKQVLLNHKKQFVLIGITVILCSILNVLHPYVIKNIINLDFGMEKILNEILKLVLIYSLIHIAFAICKNIRNIIVNKTVASILKEIRTKLFNIVITLKTSTFQEYKTSDIYTRLTVDVDNMATLFSDTLPIIINDILYIILIVIMILQLDIRIAGIAMLSIVLILNSIIFFIKKLKNINNKILDKRDILNKQYAEMYDTNKLTYMFGLQENNIKKAEETLDSEMKLRKKYIEIDTFPITVTNIIEAITITAILYFTLSFNTGIQIGDIYLVIYYIKHCRSPFNAIFNRIEELQTCLNSYKRIKKILDITNKEEIENGDSIEIKGKIEFRNVCMKYDKKQVLQDISFEIQPGQKVTIVGKTGVGKTTLTNLIMKLYDNYTGTILIDDKDIKEISSKCIRQQVSYISQKPYIFKDTLRNNIILNKKNISDVDIMNVINSIGANKLIEKFENGLDEIIDYSKVSYGELQIIAFVRAILRDTKLYIFDEPTSNMDLKSEKLIQNLINNIAKSKTVIIVAHRKSTIQNSDKIIYLKNGKVCKTNEILEMRS